MTRRAPKGTTVTVGGVTLGVDAIIEREKPQQCDFCGKIAELRPYGPKGETICFECAMKDEETMKRRFNEVTG